MHTGVGTSAVRRREDDRIAGGETALEVELSDGEIIDAELLIFSAGVRPRDQIARDSGLEVGPRGGIITDAAVRRFKAQKIYLRATVCLRWVNARMAILQGRRPESRDAQRLAQIGNTFRTVWHRSAIHFGANGI